MKIAYRKLYVVLAFWDENEDGKVKVNVGETRKRRIC